MAVSDSYVEKHGMDTDKCISKIEGMNDGDILCFKKLNSDDFKGYKIEFIDDGVKDTDLQYVVLYNFVSQTSDWKVIGKIREDYKTASASDFMIFENSVLKTKYTMLIDYFGEKTILFKLDDCDFTINLNDNKVYHYVNETGTETSADIVTNTEVS